MLGAVRVPVAGCPRPPGCGGAAIPGGGRKSRPPFETRPGGKQRASIARARFVPAGAEASPFPPSSSSSVPPSPLFLSLGEREQRKINAPQTFYCLPDQFFPPFSPNMDKSGSLSQRFVYGAAAPLAGLGTVPPGAELCWCGLRLSLPKFLCSEHNLCLAGGAEQSAGQFGDGIFCRMARVRSPLSVPLTPAAPVMRGRQDQGIAERRAAVCVWSWSLVWRLCARSLRLPFKSISLQNHLLPSGAGHRWESRAPWGGDESGLHRGPAKPNSPWAEAGEQK